MKVLYKAKPDEVKLMLIDPKKVELTNYMHLPHLIAPVINDSKKAANALKWVVNEMENRYSLFAGKGVKDMSQEEYMRHIGVGAKIVEEALQQDEVNKYITKPIKKVIYIPGRVINIII